MSDCLVTAPSNCSGAMYARLPRMAPVRVNELLRRALSVRVMPKSAR